MPGRLRKQDPNSASAKAKGICAKFCEEFCKISKCNQMICWAIIVFFVVVALLMFGGASLTEPAEAGKASDDLCTDGTDPEIPFYEDNAYAWYLGNTGVVAFVMIFSSFICCCSCFGLCCGEWHNQYIKIVSAIGLTITGGAFLILIVWAAGGTYLLIMMRPTAFLQDVCRNIFVYLVFMYVYMIAFIGVSVIMCIWKGHDMYNETRATGRVRGAKV